MTAWTLANHENTPGIWVTVTKPVWIESQAVMGDDARIEARNSKNEARASRFYSRVSLPVGRQGYELRQRKTSFSN